MTNGPDDRVVPAQDAGLLAALGEALGPDVPPAGLSERADALFSVRDLDRVLAGLLAEADAEPAGMRGGSAGATLRFEVADGSVVVEVEPRPDHLAGRVLVGEVEAVALERPAGVATTAEVDELGGFIIRGAVTGPRRLRFTGPGTPPAVTDWFLL
jgi:hypothetical protein